jgi:uncharacterized protein YndB with AHSA1/START domain
MTADVEAQADHVVITHVFDAPIEQVFRAWTDPDELAEWYGPASMRAPREHIRIDLRVGGRFELRMVSPDGAREMPLGYEIVELDPPVLLVLRSDPLPHATTVRVELERIGERTRMTLIDGPMPVGRDHAAAGYAAAIDRLAARLGDR